MCALQMYAYLATYKMPNDDPEALERRVRVAYPVKADRLLGAGTTPTLRLQRAFGTPGHFARWEKLLVWSHWVWFAFPHGTVAYVLLRHRDQFPQAAARIYATFDIGVIGYWAIPTAPPWYAAKQGLMEDGRTPELRRMMVEYGEQFWKQGWAPLYGVLGGNPLAAMPSLHFATSVTAAHVLADTGRSPARSAGPTPPRSGLALVYLGEHYVVDLAAGLALAEAIRAATPAIAPVATRLSRTLQALEAQGARMTQAPEQTVEAPRPATSTTTTIRGLEFSGRSGPDPVRLPRRDDPRPLPAAAAARGPRGHVGADRGRLARAGSGSRSCSRSACSGATSRCSAACSRGRARRPDRPERELPDHDGRPRGDAGSSPPAAPAASSCRPGRCARPGWPSASSPTRRSASSSSPTSRTRRP